MNQNNDNILIIFARNPVKGKVKTRLATGIGDEKALEAYKSFIRLTYEVSQQLESDKVVFLTETPEKNLFPGYKMQLQTSTDLGESMKAGFGWAFEKGYKKACIIGTDCPSLTQNILEEAFEQLNKHDFVIGPAEDGGYYLIGMSAFLPQVFDGVEWSTSNVLKTTLDTLRHLEKTYHLLPQLNDIDTLEDLVKYKAQLTKRLDQ